MKNQFAMFAAAGFLFLIPSSPPMAAPIVTFTQSTMVRTQVQGGGAYQVLDLFYSNSTGSEFLGYEIDVKATTGLLYDPARGQDDRQLNPPAAGQDGDTAGAVDTWVNTVMSSAAKIDGGYLASILSNPAGYIASGGNTTVPAPGFIRLNWAVSDNVLGDIKGDDNDLNNHPDGPFAATSPYHIARILASESASGTIRFETSDTSAPGTASTFNFNFGGFTDHRPIVGPEAPQTQTVNGQIITTDFDAVDIDTPAGPFTWAIAPGGFVPLYPGAIDHSADPTIDANGVFSWNTLGAARGVYTFNITAQDGGPGPPLTSPPSPFVVTVTAVPEPTILSLLGLAMVGAVGFVRRRTG